MRIIVCEDDPKYLKAIPQLIKRWAAETRHAGVTIQTFASSEAFLDAWAKGLSPDLIFLDIHFTDEANGMEVARRIRETNTYVPIVFITNTDAFLREGYTVCALRYLSKPVCLEDIAPCLHIAYNQYAISRNEFLILSSAGEQVAIRHAEIFYIEAMSPYVRIVKQSDAPPIQLRYRFADILGMLPQALFIPCHRSYIVNLMHVHRVKRTELHLSNGQKLPVSRPYAQSLNSAFDSYYQEGACINVDCV